MKREQFTLEGLDKDIEKGREQQRQAKTTRQRRKIGTALKGAESLRTQAEHQLAPVEVEISGKTKRNRAARWRRLVRKVHSPDATFQKIISKKST